jgi:hypothetical protein
MIEAHTGNPRKFYRKIRMSLNQKTNMIGAVYTKNDREKYMCQQMMRRYEKKLQTSTQNYTEQEETREPALKNG